ncbi:MAG: phosphate signaling complex protein PhoU [Ignavibacteriales bacterium]|nr:phosphate signaling complex protein PhoU [Ignavibacteriales bacterium]
MLTQFEIKIEEIKKNILVMASIVDAMVEDAFAAIEKNDAEFIASIKLRDKTVDEYDILIQEKCEGVLALFQPVATDLRYIITVLMINNQLERCGDIAVNISQRIKKLGDAKNLFRESEIIDMGKQARLMVKEAIDSFINEDISLARTIREKDKIVDSYNKTIFNFLVEKMQADSSVINPASHMIIISKHIERLADHAKNIAEEVVFLIDAEIVVHRKNLKE